MANLLFAFLDFDSVSVAIAVPGLGEAEMLRNSIVGSRGMGAKAIKDYRSYYYSRTPAAFHRPAPNGLPPPIDCRRPGRDEFAVDFLRPQGIRGFCGDFYPDPTGRG